MTDLPGITVADEDFQPAKVVVTVKLRSRTLHCPECESTTARYDTRPVASSWRSRRTLDTELVAQGVVGISGIDTRALTRHLREAGAMRVGVSSVESDPAALLARVLGSPLMAGADLAGEVSTRQPYVVPAIGTRRFTVAALDLGIKAMTPHRMAQRGITTHVLPSRMTAADIQATRPDA